MIIVPYVLSNGAWTISDTEICKAHDQLFRDGTLETIFPQSAPISPDDLCAFFKAPGILPQFVYEYKEQIGPMMGFAWLSDLRQKWALGNFATFRPHWGRRTLEMGRNVLNLWFRMEHHGEPVFDTIGGVTPSRNRLAVQYIEHLGFTVLGEIPIGDKSVTISYMTREQFDGWRR